MILSPEEYYRLTEIEENYTLLLETAERSAKSGAAIYEMDDVMKQLAIQENEDDNIEDVIIN